MHALFYHSAGLYNHTHSCTTGRRHTHTDMYTCIDPNLGNARMTRRDVSTFICFSIYCIQMPTQHCSQLPLLISADINLYQSRKVLDLLLTDECNVSIHTLARYSQYDGKGISTAGQEIAARWTNLASLRNATAPGRTGLQGFHFSPSHRQWLQWFWRIWWLCMPRTHIY